MRTLAWARCFLTLCLVACGGGGVETNEDTPPAEPELGVPDDPPSDAFPEDSTEEPPQELPVESSGGAAGSTGDDADVGGVGGTETASDCPTNGPPTGPFAMRFDISTLQCGGGTCSGNEDKCLCLPDFEALATLPQHFLAVSSDMNKAVTWGSSNVQAVYVDDLNTDWKLGGKARADALIAKMKNKFPCGVPKWFLMNEISHSMWPTLPDYRQFVIDFAKTMKGVYKKSVVIAAPYQKITANAASWTELQKHAFIGIEAYLSGKEIKEAGFSVAFCQSEYAAASASYAKQGVPKSRQFLFEHFGNTGTVLDNGILVKWGRQAVSAADWHKAIKVRSAGAHQVGFAGFVSFDWGANGIHAPESDRLAFMKTYRSQVLP